MEKDVGNWDQRKDVKMKNMTERAKSAVMLDGEISKYVDISQGVAQERTLSPNLLNIYIY